MAAGTLPRQPRVSTSTRNNIAIIASVFNKTYVDALVESARAEIAAIIPNAVVPVYRVPGAGEIPVCAEFVASRAKPDVIIALGVIIRGETSHADLIAHTAASALQDIAKAHLKPVINQVLLVEDEAQAHARCFGTEINRGIEAARAALSMMDLFSQLETTYPVES